MARRHSCLVVTGLVVAGLVAAGLLGCGDAARGDDPVPSTTFPPGTSVDASDATGDESGASSSSEDDGAEAPSEEASSSGGDAPETFADIARITITPGFTDQGGGVWSLGETAMDEVGLAFYAQHPDDYDFIVVYTEGDVAELGAFAYAVQYETGGIGFGSGGAPWISPADVGSAGRLLQLSFMNTPKLYAGEPDDASIVVHETTHHWSAYIELPGTPAPGYLLDEGYGGHWNIHAHTGGPSATGYGDVVDLGDGRFQYTVMYPLQLSPLELYLAGLIPPDEVPPMFYVQGGHDYEPAMPPYGGAWTQGSYSMDASYAGTRVDFTVQDVIAGNGVRTPAFGAAQTDFRFAFVLVCTDATACDPTDLALVEAQRTAFEVQLSTATGGRATADTSL